MTRPARADWHQAWTLHAPSGSAHHAPTGLQVLVWPAGRQVEGLVRIGTCTLDASVVDRRDPATVPDGHPNAPGVRHWVLWAPASGPGSPLAALDALCSTMPPHDAAAALARLQREAAQLWAFRARLDRERPRAAAEG